MSAAQSALVLIPRFTSLVGVDDYSSAALDVSGFGSLQIELWRGPLVGSAAGAKFKAYLEESLDGVTWQPDASAARPHDPGESKSLVLAHVFSLRWFRLRVGLEQSDAGATQPMVTCWAEGMLR